VPCPRRRALGGFALVKPREAVEKAGGKTELLSLETGQIQAMNSDINPADKFDVDKAIAEASPDNYDGLIPPGGTVNADKLRMSDDVVSFVQKIFKDGKPAGVICHGRGRWSRLTSCGSAR
jgi:protease I